MAYPDVSIILVTKNAGGEFKKVLQRVKDQQYAGDVEIIVIDSESTDKTPEIAERMGTDLYTIPSEEFHHGRTRNLGGDLASGEILVYLVQDALPSDDQWLVSLISPIIDGDASVVYGRQIAYSDAKPMDAFFYSYFYPDSRTRIGPQDVSDKNEFYLDHVFISDVSAAMSADIWSDIKFDDQFEMSEDKDFAFRVLTHGEPVVYEPKAAVYHSHSYNLMSLFKRRFEDGRAYAEISGGGGGGGFLRRGINYFASELKYMLSGGHVLWIPYAVLYDLVYYISFNLGTIYGTHIE